LKRNRRRAILPRSHPCTAGRGFALDGAPRRPGIATAGDITTWEQTMKNSHLICVVALGMFVAACAHTPTPSPFEFRILQFSLNKKEKDCSGKRCDIAIVASWADCFPSLKCVEFDKVYVKAKDTDITWYLPEGLEFCENEGVFLKRPTENDGEFDAMYRADKDGKPVTGSTCTRYFHWLARNTGRHKNKDWEYGLTFSGGVLWWKIDPYIVSN
jgi:hypothetical protein